MGGSGPAAAAAVDEGIGGRRDDDDDEVNVELEGKARTGAAETVPDTLGGEIGADERTAGDSAAEEAAKGSGAGMGMGAAAALLCDSTAAAN